MRYFITVYRRNLLLKSSITALIIFYLKGCLIIISLIHLVALIIFYLKGCLIIISLIHLVALIFWVGKVEYFLKICEVRLCLILYIFHLLIQFNRLVLDKLNILKCFLNIFRLIYCIWRCIICKLCRCIGLLCRSLGIQLGLICKAWEILSVVISDLRLVGIA